MINETQFFLQLSMIIVSKLGLAESLGFETSLYNLNPRLFI